MSQNQQGWTWGIYICLCIRVWCNVCVCVCYSPANSEDEPDLGTTDVQGDPVIVLLK